MSTAPRRGATTRVVLALALAAAALGHAEPAPEAGGEAGAAAPGDGMLMRAMRDELSRSLQNLVVEDLERPYFIAYRVVEEDVLTTSARFGALDTSQRNRSRRLAIEMRVGSAELDNSNFVGRNDRARMRTLNLPLDDDYDQLRRRLWLATDAAYKNALETMAKKTAALQSRRREEVPDFAAAEPQQLRDERTADAPPDASIEALARDLSGVFREAPDIVEARALAGFGVRRTHYVNSEGTEFVRARSGGYVQVLARAQALGGAQLQDFETFNGRSLGELPPPAEMLARTRDMAATLAARRAAEPLESYSGPVLFEGQAAAELLAQAFVPRLLAIRPPVPENANMEPYLQAQRNPFLDKLGARVLPRFLDVVDDPSLDEFGGERLYGSYLVDDDGVPAARTELIVRGRLRTLLASRTPVAGVDSSTGNRRDLVLPSNLLVLRDDGAEAAEEARAELAAEFDALVADRGLGYGVVVRRLGNFSSALGGSQATPGQTSVEPPSRAYRVYPDGREELIQSAEISGFSEAAFKDVVAAAGSSAHTLRLAPLSNIAALSSNAAYGFVRSASLVTIVTPDLLFEEVTLRAPQGNVPRPPVAGHPYFEE